MKSKIVLIGYRSTGKSTVAKLLSRRLRVPMIDTDEAIEERCGKSIARIFSEDGEPRFRDLEAEIVAELLEKPEPLIVSTGGGAPLREETRLVMKSRSVVFWLAASVETIARRMTGDETTESRRPSLTVAKSPVDEIASVLAAREPLYRETSTFIVDTENQSIQEVVDEIYKLSQADFVCS